MPFPSYGSLTAFFYSTLKLKLMPSNDESRREISTRFTYDICLVVNGNTQVTE